MQVVSIFIAFLAVTRLAFAQSQAGYNYPSPFNQLTPGSSSDLGGVPGSTGPSSQQPTPYPGSQSGYNNQQYTPSGPPSFGASQAPGFNQQPFGQPTPSTLSTLAPSGGLPNVPSLSSAGGFGPSSPSGFPSTAAPSPKGFESGFPHSAGHAGGHSGLPGAHSGLPGAHSGLPSAHSSGSLPSAHSGGHSGVHPSSGGFGGSQPTFSGASPSFPGSPADSGSSGFGAPSSFGNQGVPSGPGLGQSFGGQQNNFGQTGGSTQFQGQDQGEDSGAYNGGDYSAIPGTPGVDYPIYTEIPKTSFDCKNQQFPGYYADVEAQCQVFHICALNTTFNFLCPNGTIFSQEHLVCVWWNQFDCNSAPGLFGNNAYIYDYSKTGQSQDGSSGAQGPSRNYPSGPDAQGGFDGAQGGYGSSQPPSSGFGSSQPPSSGFGGSQPSSNGFGAPSGFGGSPSSNGFGASQPGSTGFGTTPPVSSGFGSTPPVSSGFGSTPPVSSGFGSTGYPAASSPSSGSPPGFGAALPGSAGFGGSQPNLPSANIPPSSGFGQPGASSHSHTPGFGGHSHQPSSGSSHTSSHNVPSSHSFPSQTGVDQYPIAPPSQNDYQPSPVITPTLPSSPTPFSGGAVSPSSFSGIPAVTGYPAAGTPAPSLGGAGDLPSREYLPSRRAQ